MQVTFKNPKTGELKQVKVGLIVSVLGGFMVAGCVTPLNQSLKLMPNQSYAGGTPGVVAGDGRTQPDSDEYVQETFTRVRVSHEANAIVVAVDDTVTHDNWEVMRDTSAANIKIQKFNLYVLVKKSSSNISCPVTYQIMDITETVYRRVRPIVSKEFGTCSEASKVEVVNGALIVTLLNKDGSPSEFSYSRGNLTEKKIEKIAACIHSQGSSSHFLPCNSCELEKKARDAMADGYDKAGFADVGAIYRADTKPLGLVESTDKNINATVAETLRGKASPENIKVCIPPNGLPAPMVVEYIKLWGLHGFVANYGLPGAVTPFE
jgi:hypothetical protein